jgi:hypothetical protein
MKCVFLPGKAICILGLIALSSGQLKESIAAKNQEKNKYYVYYIFIELNDDLRHSEMSLL